MNMKKQGLAFYLNVLAFLLGAAGLAAVIISNRISAENVMQRQGVVTAAGLLGLALICAAIVLPGKKGNHDPLSALSVLGAIALFSYVYGQCIIQRVMLVAGLFSFNSGNKAGWQIFYISIAAIACLILADLLLIAGSFCRSVREA